MKKIFIGIVIALLMATAAVMPASAKRLVVKGEVTAVDASTITVLTEDDQTLTVIPPVDFDISTLSVGDIIIARGWTQPDGSLKANVLRILETSPDEEETPSDENDSGDEETPGDEENPDDEQSTDKAFCNPDVKQGSHPMAAKLSSIYGVDIDWVMKYYCDGMGFGEIMIAIRSSLLTAGEEKPDIETAADELLSKRAEGKGWGEILQEIKLIGRDKGPKIPPGSLKKPNKGHTH